MKTYRSLMVLAVLAIVLAPALTAAGETDISDAGAAALRQQLAAFRQGDYAAASQRRSRTPTAACSSLSACAAPTA